MSELATSLSVRIFAVIVLYKTAPLDSISFQTLQNAIAHSSGNKTTVRVFFYDNTPEGQPPEIFPRGVSYESPNKNAGLAAAYNRALEIAYEEGFDWLLTLDQDTELPIDFICKLGDAAAFVTPMSDIAAIVPQIYDRDRMISPNTLLCDIFPRFFPAGFVGISRQKTSAVNSAATIRISALRKIGGYDPRFWLDYSDAVMFHRLDCSNMRVFVAGNIRVQHELSVLDMKNRVTIERYNDILGAESAFWDEYMGKIAGPALLIRFLYRLCYKLWRTGASPQYFRTSLRFFYRRFFYSRNRRMEAWELSAKQRLK